MKLFVSAYPGKVGVAVSGGVDSMVLLDLYRSIGQNLVVINIEHGIRGEESVRDSRFVADFCEKAGIECLQFCVKTLEREEESIELAARKLRYEVFERVLSEKKADVIALAHHADDNAETILMRIFRGTGIRGLMGIREREGFIRPLLNATRADIEEYAVAHRLPYVTDSTNLDNDCRRNFIRHEILPKIKEIYPDVLTSFCRLAENATEAEEYLSAHAPMCEKKTYGYRIPAVFDADELTIKYAVRNALEKLGILQDIEKRHYGTVIALKGMPNNTVIDLPFGVRACRYGSDLYLTNRKEETFFAVFDRKEKYNFVGYEYSFEPSENMVRGISIDGERIPDGAEVRTRKDGDMFWRVNGKNKLLSDFLNEKKMCAFEKEGLLVLAKGRIVYAVLGLETAEQVKVTGRCLLVRKEEK